MGRKLEAEALSDAEAAAARQGLGDEAAPLTALRPGQWLALAQALAAEGDAAAVGAIGRRVADKALQKEVRRLEHALRSRGVSVAERARTGLVGDVSRVDRGEAQGWGLPANLSGEVIVRLAYPGPEKLWCCALDLTDRIGVEAAPISPRRLAEGLEQEAKHLQRGLFTPLPAPLRAAALAEGLRRCAQAGISLSADMLVFQTFSEYDPRPPVEILRSFVLGAGVKPERALSISADLLMEPLWQRQLSPPLSSVEEVMRELKAQQPSALILSPRADLDRRASLLARHVAAMAARIDREQLLFGLWYNAALTHLRQEPWAGTFAGVAEALAEGQAEPAQIPLFVESFERLVRAIEAWEASSPEAPEGGAGGSGLIY